MSLYRVGDIVVVDFSDNVGGMEIAITEVTDDQPDGSGRESSYFGDDHDGNEWGFSDSMVVNTINLIPRIMDAGTPDQFREEVQPQQNVPIIVGSAGELDRAMETVQQTIEHEDAMRAALHEAENALVWGTPRRRIAPRNDEDTPSVRQGYTTLMNEYEERLRNRRLNTSRDFADFLGNEFHPRPADPEPPPPATPAFNIEPGREIRDIDARHPTLADYRPTFGMTRHLTRFNFVYEGIAITLVPELIGDGQTYAFFDQMGQEWISQHTSGFDEWVPSVRDEANQRWHRLNAAPRKKARKKKLRRKQPMPEIKDAKYYATSDYVG
jgi:hypothetical protein